MKGAMREAIENINLRLNFLTEEWNWEFKYAPERGQQRIQIIAVSKLDPEQRKVLVFTEEVVKAVPASKLCPHIIQLLPAIRESHAGEDPSPCHEVFQPTEHADMPLRAETGYDLPDKHLSAIDLSAIGINTHL